MFPANIVRCRPTNLKILHNRCFPKEFSKNLRTTVLQDIFVWVSAYNKVVSITFSKIGDEAFL